MANVVMAILAAALAAAVIIGVTAPVRAARRPAGPAEQPGPLGEAERADLEAAREAKYREIRDAELDYRTGKLSEEDYRAIDAGLRAEAIAILDRLEGPCGSGAAEAGPAEREGAEAPSSRAP